jgi:HSP20 family molecular chaperone IbpA
MTKTGEKTAAQTPETTRGGRIYQPLTDIIETDQGVTLTLEMPGVAPDEVDITLEKRVLTIRGKVAPTQPEKLELAHAEYGEGDFERAFTMSEDFDPDKIEASMRNGVLTVTLPRAAEAHPKKITVSNG